MPETKIGQIIARATDATGATITTVYAKRPPLYAVYRTPERVVIQFADDDVEQDRQRAALATLSPVRGQINGLIDGWRSSKKKHLQSDASRYDAQVADALVVALENDVGDARAILDAIKSNIFDKRTSWARLQYLITSTCAAVFFIFLLCLLNWLLRSLLPDGATNLFLGAAAGSAGAFFSIALGVRTRTVLTDLHFWDNTVDAVLRVIIGCIGGALLVAFLQSKLAVVVLDAAPVDDKMTASWAFILLAGFIAGFSERLVPDILAKATAEVDKPAALVKASGRTETAAWPAASAAAFGKNFDAEGENESDSESDTDSCLCGNDVHDHEITPDTELPPASGGVAAPRAAPVG